ncbi:MAG: hypothetical protein Q8R08_03980 [bacterium]|nr:hypothetical protein [bacterium]
MITMIRKNKGQVIIISLMFMLIILSLAAALFGYVFQNVSATRRAVAKEQALQLADAGIDKAVYELNQSAGGYTGESGTVLGTGVFDVTVQVISNSVREVTATGYAPDRTNPKATRQIKVQIGISSVNANFFYGVQVGDGGLIMDNNSEVSGNVYSNGAIDGGSGASITGDAFSANASGRIFDRLQIGQNAHSHQIDSQITVGGNAYGQVMDNITVTGHVFSNSIANCTVGGNAFYTTKTACTITGTENTPYAGEPDPVAIDLPLTDDDINGFKTEAEAGGIIVGDYTVPLNQTRILGPKKITGNLVLENNSTLVLTGTIWVAGNITTGNNSAVELDAAYGNNSEVIVSDAVIDVVNNTDFVKAGETSYIMMLTTRVGDSSFRVANNSDALIAYASAGEVNILQNAILREVTGWKIRLEENAVVTYESGLANVNFSGGPGGSWRILRGTWREIK